jgi:hypothetical protein
MDEIACFSIKILLRRVAGVDFRVLPPRQHSPRKPSFHLNSDSSSLSFLKAVNRPTVRVVASHSRTDGSSGRGFLGMKVQGRPSTPPASDPQRPQASAVNQPLK